ncbi:hypothetical protein QZM62_12795 [Burkholderia multivorans]|nr:hypothetical protein [Burkholderia multivorans]
MADGMIGAPAEIIDVEVTEIRVPDASRLCQWFEESEQMTYDARKLSERDRDYYDGQQWTRAELEALAKRGQPALTVNYVKRKVEYLRGFERRMRSDPKAFPRTPHEDQLAEAATDSLRYVADQNDFDVTRSDVYEDMLIEGYGGADVTVDEGRDGYDVKITRIPWDRIWFDPYSRQKDFSDARYLGVVIWMDRDEALETFPDRQDEIENTLASVSLSDTYDDRPGKLRWADNRRTRVRVVQCHWKQDGIWFIATYTKGGYLTDPMPSPYIGRDGRPSCSLILRSAYVDRENQRYGHVRDMISLQDEVNKRRSKALHLVSVRQTFGNQNAISDVDKAKRALARPDGHVEINAGGKFGEDFGILPTGDMVASQLQLMQHATAELQASGPNAAMAGKDPRIQSGRAIQAQQAGGAIEVEPIIDDLRQWTKQIYEAAWLRIRQFWTSEKWIRVTDDEKNTRWVGLNRQVTLADALAELPPEEAAAMAQQIGLQPNDPRLNQVVRVDNDIAGLDVDITIEEGPDVANVQAEQFQMLAQLAPALAQAGDPIPPEVLIAASQLRNKDELLEKLEQGRAARAQGQQQMQKIGMAQQQANVEKTNAQANKANAEAQRTMAEIGQPTGAAPVAPDSPSTLDQLEQAAKIRKLDAETGRIQTEAVRNIADAQRPPMVADFA